MTKSGDNIICPGCKNEIDEEVCWCGDYRAGHTYEHSFVPMGCDCGRCKTPENLKSIFEEYAGYVKTYE